MNYTELEQALIDAGCSPHQFKILELGDDCECLIEEQGEWQVAYAERGFVREILFRSAHEEEACAFLWDRMQRRVHLHLVGIFRQEPDAAALEQALRALGIIPSRDSIPYSAQQRLFRVFVQGKEVFVARAHFSDLPLHHWPPQG